MLQQLTLSFEFFTVHTFYAQIFLVVVYLVSTLNLYLENRIYLDIVTILCKYIDKGRNRKLFRMF